MKKLIGWVCDPYVHMILIGLLLVRLAMGTNAEDRGATNATSLSLGVPVSAAKFWDGGDRLSDRLADTFSSTAE